MVSLYPIDTWSFFVVGVIIFIILVTEPHLFDTSNEKLLLKSGASCCPCNNKYAWLWLALSWRRMQHAMQNRHFLSSLYWLQGFSSCYMQDSWHWWSLYMPSLCSKATSQCCKWISKEVSCMNNCCGSNRFSYCIATQHRIAWRQINRRATGGSSNWSKPCSKAIFSTS